MKKHLLAEEIIDASQLRGLSRIDLIGSEFYQREDWVEKFFEILFKIQSRGTTVNKEVYFGLVHFISCAYVLVVVPSQLARVGYPYSETVVAVGLCCGIGSIIGGNIF